METKLTYRAGATFAEIDALYAYDPATGVFTWKVVRPKGQTFVGMVAGTVNPDGYRQLMVKGKTYKAHRIAWLLMTGAWPEFEVDHKNRTRDDNRWVNLRPATDEQNAQNSSLSRRNKSGVRGISWHKAGQKWMVGIRGEYLGLYASLDEARAVRMAAEQSRFGEYAPKVS